MEIEKTAEDRAREMGWSPKEEFRGNPDRWVDAEEYIERGETMLPLVKASEKRTKEKLDKVEGELATTKQLLADAQESIVALTEYNSKENREKMKAMRTATKEALVVAKRDGDVEGEIELTETLREQTNAIREAEKGEEKGEGKTVQVNGSTKDTEETDLRNSPAWKEWAKDNPWFGTDRRRSALSMGIADEIRQNPETKDLRGREFLDKVSEEVEKVMPTRKATNKVEDGGRGTGGGGGGEGKSYADLPQEAKDACERMSKRVVGKGKVYKSNEEWRAKYAVDFYSQE